ncbi:MAG: hypothetical protein JO304_04880 [Solirubrobacterales bacterium]|nr:hypothetical protein [Solirubrobacterales bacterium]
MAGTVCRGDVVLVDELGQGWVSWAIAVGARLTYRRDKEAAKWTHVAIVYEATSQDPNTISIVEARAQTGVHKAFLSKYRKRKIVHTNVGDHDWAQVQEFLDDVLRKREGYDFIANIGLFLWAVTGSQLCIQRAGTATCSGLVACALTRRGFVWSRPPFAMTPAGIAVDLLDRFGCKST